MSMTIQALEQLESEILSEFSETFKLPQGHLLDNLETAGAVKNLTLMLPGYRGLIYSDQDIPDTDNLVAVQHQVEHRSEYITSSDTSDLIQAVKIVAQHDRGAWKNLADQIHNYLTHHPVLRTPNPPPGGVIGISKVQCLVSSGEFDDFQPFVQSTLRVCYTTYFQP